MQYEPYTPTRELLGDGDFYLSERTFPPIPMAIPNDLSALYCNLQLIRGVGPVTEGRLKQEGYRDLASLRGHTRWGTRACDIIAAIEEGAGSFLAGCGAPEHHVLSLYSPEQIGFVDIETTGLYSAQPLFLVGIMSFSDEEDMLLRQFLARSYDEEAAVLHAVREEFTRLRVLVTYNGRRFDLPYIRDRMLYHGAWYPMDHFHIDVLRATRRLFRGVLPDCRLVTVASHLVGYERNGDVPGYMIPEVYHEFVQSRRPALIRPILEHNAMDIHALALIMGAVLQA